ncbi:hypothetical protein J6590_097761 [Homalodisca vitripennis]|nr:hypothetical protein J6590_097761 [Homalodisca vitripennis]
MPTPAAREESATTPQRPASIQDVSYADAVRRSPSSLRLLHQNAQYATNKLDEIQLMCEELKSDILVVTENGFNNENLELCKIPNYNLAEAYCRQTSKGGGVAIFLRQNLVLTKFTIKDTETVHRRSHTHSKPSGKRAPMVANGMPDQNKTR